MPFRRASFSSKTHKYIVEYLANADNHIAVAQAAHLHHKHVAPCTWLVGRNRWAPYPGYSLGEATIHNNSWQWKTMPPSGP